jgi:hypothetical protein
MALVIPKDTPPHLRPAFELTSCPFCGMKAAWRWDRKNRPFHYCGDCGVRVFLYSSAGLVGFEMLCEVMRRVGPLRWRQEAQSRITRRQIATTRAERHAPGVPARAR